MKEIPLSTITKLGRNSLAHGASFSVDRESQKNTEATWDHHLHISPDTSPFMETVFSMVSKIHGKQSDDVMEDLKVNLTICGIFMNVTLQAVVHLGRFISGNLWENYMKRWKD